jgi:hypothetical protein
MLPAWRRRWQVDQASSGVFPLGQAALPACFGGGLAAAGSANGISQFAVGAGAPSADLDEFHGVLGWLRSSSFRHFLQRTPVPGCQRASFSPVLLPLGHESFATTQRYAHLAPDAHSKVLESWARRTEAVQ